MSTDNFGPMAISERLARRLTQALENTGLIEIVEPRAAVGQIHLLARIRKEGEKAFLYGPGKLILSALKKFPRTDIFIGKSFFIRADDLRYAWVVSIGSDQLEECVELVVNALGAEFEPAPKRKLDLSETPLLGPAAPQSATRPGARGAAPVRG